MPFLKKKSSPKSDRKNKLLRAGIINVLHVNWLTLNIEYHFCFRAVEYERTGAYCSLSSQSALDPPNIMLSSVSYDYYDLDGNCFLPRIADATITKKSGRVGTVRSRDNITVTCAEGFVIDSTLTQNITLQCHVGEQWSSVVCVYPVQCGTSTLTWQSADDLLTDDNPMSCQIFNKPTTMKLFTARASLTTIITSDLNCDDLTTVLTLLTYDRYCPLYACDMKICVRIQNDQHSSTCRYYCKGWATFVKVLPSILYPNITLCEVSILH